jgi:hypothetical protein
VKALLRGLLGLLLGAGIPYVLAALLRLPFGIDNLLLIMEIGAVLGLVVGVVSARRSRTTLNK